MTDIHIFISHTSEDKALVARPLADLLRERGHHVWLDESELTLGIDIRKGILHAMATCRHAIVVLSPPYFEKKWTQLELDRLQSRELAEGTEIIIPVRYQMTHDDVKRFSRTLADRLSADIQDGIEAAVCEIERTLERRKQSAAEGDAAPNRPGRGPIDFSDELSPPKGVDPDNSPYVGPRPFPDPVAHRLYGRNDDIRSLLDLIERSRVVLLHSASGAGKSSLLNALSVRYLKDRGFQVLRARVGGELPPQAKMGNVRNVFTFAAICSLDGSHSPHPKLRMAQYLDAIHRDPTQQRILIFDQFEELFPTPGEIDEDQTVFLNDLVEALEGDPSLRILFAARQESLADIEAITERHLPPGMRMRALRLNRLGAYGALEAIVKSAAPYADFAPGVAEEIVDQLRTIPSAAFRRGVSNQRRSEFVEAVQLQIVCDRLWKQLPHGIKVIEKRHIEHAVGHGEAFEKFVADALRNFYEATLQMVVSSNITEDHGGYSKELIQLGCRRFITDAGTRTMVRWSRVEGRTGRLPDWIIEQLVTAHLLRAEERGGEVWYELSHDRLAEMIHREMNPKVSQLVYAAEMLENLVKKFRDPLTGHANLAGYFEEHRDVLNDCSLFHEQEGLVAEESELVLRASLRAGQHMQQWSHRVKQDFPEVHARVLQEALRSPLAQVRRNVITLLGDQREEAFLPSVVDLALRDDDPGVREATAKSLVRLERRDLYQALFSAMATPERRGSAIDALTSIRIIADNKREAPVFEACFKENTRSARRTIRGHAWRRRLFEGFLTPVYLAISAAVFAAISAAAYKWYPSLYNWAVVQPLPGAAPGIFHGFIAGPVWAGCTLFGIALYRLAFERELAKRSFLRPAGAILAGAIGALVGSLFIVWMMLGIYEPYSLYEMGWLTGTPERFSPEFWRDVFVTTRFGWVHLITGVGIGVGMAATVNSLRSREAWLSYIREQSEAKGYPRIARIVGRLVMIEVRSAGYIPLGIGLAAVAAFFVPVFYPSPASALKTNAVALRQGLFGDCSTQAIGAFFAITGMGLGEILIRRLRR